LEEVEQSRSIDTGKALLISNNGKLKLPWWTLPSVEIELITLDVGRTFSTWDSCELFLKEWAKKQGFRIVKDRVYREEGVIRRRTFICVHSRSYDSNSNKDTSSKRTRCPFLVNTSCPKVKNPETLVFINKVVDKHNHALNKAIIEFEESRKFTSEMMENIKFMTVSCKFGTTAQRKFLESKFPSHPIHSKDLYAAINKFRPTQKSLSNDAAQISNWLDQQKELDSRWFVVRGWDDDNALTHLLWMTPEQIENWIQYSDCVLNDITHKTNRYGMALSLFVGFNNDRRNILLAQGLLADESLESHIWMFSQIIKATGVHPGVILTDADPAVDSAIHQIFIFTYPIHCAYHITQNLHKNLRKVLGEEYQKFLDEFYLCRNSFVEDCFQQRFDKLIQDYPNARNYLEFLYKSKTSWAHCFTGFRFTGGMIATSRVESVNACLKRLLYNSNVSLCDLMGEIHKLLDLQDKENEYKFWQLSIPTIRNQNKVNFLFTKIDQCLQRYLTASLLKMHRDEMNQSLYYIAVPITQEDAESMDEDQTIFANDTFVDTPQATLKRIIKFVGSLNIKEIWAVMLATRNAYFHIRLIPTRWYNESRNGSEEPFLLADKYMQDDQTITHDSNGTVAYLCLFDQDCKDFREESLTVLEQKAVYGKLHSIYKKALHKALQNHSKSQQLIGLLQEFAEEDINEQSDSNKSLQANDISDGENDNSAIPQLRNPKKHRGKGRPLGTKRFKSSHESYEPKIKHQRQCKKCGNVGHYQKNCK
ncbi:2359_t:CDS:2, partial [Ambispora gerdemannii]